MDRSKLDLILKNKKGVFSVQRDNSSELVNAKFIKQLREKMDMTQVVFSSAIGVSVKTIEKWEQGSVEPRDSVKKYLYLLNKYPELMNDLYLVKNSNISVNKYGSPVIHIVKQKTNDGYITRSNNDIQDGQANNEIDYNYILAA